MRPRDEDVDARERRPKCDPATVVVVMVVVVSVLVVVVSVLVVVVRVWVKSHARGSELWRVGDSRRKSNEASLQASLQTSLTSSRSEHRSR